MLRKKSPNSNKGRARSAHLGSGNLSDAYEHDLVDNFWLMSSDNFGGGQKLFARHDPGGVQGDGKHCRFDWLILMNYERAGAVQTGTIGNNNLDSLWNCGLPND